MNQHSKDHPQSSSTVASFETTVAAVLRPSCSCSSCFVSLMVSLLLLAAAVVVVLVVSSLQVFFHVDLQPLCSLLVHPSSLSLSLALTLMRPSMPTPLLFPLPLPLSLLQLLLCDGKRLGDVMRHLKLVF